MMGYVRPDKPELKVRELAGYEGWYCGLCRSIGKRYGQLARLTLSYDCTFLGMLLGGIDGCSSCIVGRCPYKPFSRKRLFAPDSEALRFAADVNICIAWYKLSDDRRDEKRFIAAVGQLFLHRAYGKAMKLAPDVDFAVKASVDRLSALEAINCAEPDAPAEAFASMFSDIIALAPVSSDNDRRVLSHMLCCLGKWLYYADAWDDRGKDSKSGSYNPFLACEADSGRASFLLNCSLNDAIRAYELLEFVDNKGVLDNIMYRGVPLRTDSLTGERNTEDVKSL